MKKLIRSSMILMVFMLSNCKSGKTCTCTDMVGQKTTGIELVAGEECNDLEPMMGTCEEE